jgi:TPR repeat protein
MKIVFKALYLFVALILAVPVIAQTDFEATKLRAEAGDSQAQYELGYIYANGMGVTQSDKEAVNWYRLAAEQGNSDGSFHLGYMYYNGRGVVQDYQEAVKWYGLAAEQGDNVARFRVRAIQAETSQAPITQQQRCTSNANEINNQIARLSSAYDARFEDLRSRSLQAGLRGTAAYGLGGFSRGVEEAGIDRERDQLTLQKQRDIADLRSRIIEICDPLPILQDNSASIERGTNIANTLKDLSELHGRGVLTDEEFQAAKRKALGLD